MAFCDIISNVYLAQHDILWPNLKSGRSNNSKIVYTVATLN